jgi:polynucleotide 5'-kinase involved in rRNA processing
MVSAVREHTVLKLRPIEMGPYGRTVCLPGTGQEVLGFVIEWVTRPTRYSNVLWMYGLAGSGKSTLSTTVANYFQI